MIPPRHLGRRLPALSRLKILFDRSAILSRACFDPEMDGDCMSTHTQIISHLMCLAMPLAILFYVLPAVAQDSRYSPGGAYDPPVPVQPPPGGPWATAPIYQAPANYSAPVYNAPAYPTPSYSASNGQNPVVRADNVYAGAYNPGVQAASAATYPPVSAATNTLPASPTAGTIFAPTVVPADVPSGGLIGGAGVYYFQPRWGSNPAYGTSLANATASQTLQLNTQQDFQMNGQFAPLVWLGYVGPGGLGIRARWSQFHGNTTLSADDPPQTDPNTTTTIFSASPLGIGFEAVSTPGVDNALQFTSSLTVDVTDLEIIRDWHFGRGSLLFGAGLRYAQLNQSYNATCNSVPTDPTLDTFTTDLTSGHTFHGIGPLVSLEARWPVGETGLALLASGRGALLLGTGHQYANMISSDIDQYGNLVSQSVANQGQSGGGTLPMLEFEVGAEWGKPIGRSDLVIQAAVVGQAWFSTGNAANQQSIFASGLPANSPVYQETLGMIGLRLTAALTY